MPGYYESAAPLRSPVAAAAVIEADVIRPTPYQLFIDIDSAAAFKVFKEQFELLNEMLLATFESKPSKSGGEHRHVIVTMPHKVTPLERIALQAMLGSDLKRELLSWHRVNTDTPDPTVFFESRPPTPVVAPRVPHDDQVDAVASNRAAVLSVWDNVQVSFNGIQWIVSELTAAVRIPPTSTE